MKYIVCALGLFLSLPATARQMRIIAAPPKPVFGYMAKVYNTVGYSRETKMVLWPNAAVKTISKQEDFHFLQPSVAFAWTTKRTNMCEVEVNSFSLAKRRDITYAYDSNRNYQGTLGGATVSSSDISIRVERVVNFDKANRLRIKPMLGFGLNPYYTLDRFVPHTSITHPVTTQQIGVRGYIVPRINYNISNRLVLDINIPVLVAKLEGNSVKEYNPLIGKEDSHGVFDFTAFPREFSARVGLGLRL